MTRLTLRVAVILSIIIGHSAFAQSWDRLTNAPTGGHWYLNAIAASADGSRLILGAGFPSYPVAQIGPLLTSTDSGTTWMLTGAPSNIWLSVASSADGTRLAATGLSADLTTGRIYTSSDSGLTWTSTSPSYNWLPVAMSADGTTLAAGTVATNGQQGLIYVSTNSGGSWTLTFEPPDYNPIMEGLAISADGTKMVLATYSGSIYTSHDSGETWESNNVPVSGWQSVATSVNGKNLIAASYDGLIITSVDSGASWMSNNLAGHPWLSVSSSADGSHLIVTAKGVIYTSVDSGATWISNSVPDYYWLQSAASADGAKLFVTAGPTSAVYRSETTLSPTMRIQRSGPDLVLSWILPSTNFTLQQSPDVDPASWVAVTSTPTLNLGSLENEVTVAATNSQNFYRLSTP